MWPEPTLDEGAAPGAARATLLVFRVAGAACALPVERVREIVRVPVIFRVPGAAPHVRGLVNLRGRIVPVVDPAPRLGHDAALLGERSRLVVTEHGAELVAFLVDDVAELARVPGDAVRHRADEHDLRCVRGGFDHAGRSVLVLDLDALIAPAPGAAR